MKKIIDHKHIPTRKSNNCICLICGTIINSILISQKSNELLYEIEQYPIELFNNLLSQDSNRKYSAAANININNKRKALIDKLLLIKKKLRLTNKIFHLTVYLTDMIIDNVKVIKYDQIGLGCLILAVKYLQNESEVPEMKHFEMKLNDIFYSNEELKRYEVYCIQAIKYRLNVVTPIDYIEYFSSKGLLFTYELNHHDNSTENTNSISNNLNANNILATIHEILLKIVNRLSYSTVSSLHIASSCLCLARELYGIKQKWNPVFASVYKTPFADFQKVYEQIKDLYNNTQKSSLGCPKVKVLSQLIQKEDNLRCRDFFSKKKKQRTLSLGVGSSFLNQYIKENLDSFHNKERIKQHSNESSCKKETAQSINATPEYIPIIPIRKYKYQNMNFPIMSNNMMIYNSKITMNKHSKFNDFIDNYTMNANTTDKTNSSKNPSRKIFQGYKIKNTKEHLNNSLVATSDKNLIHSYCKSTNKKQRPFSKTKAIIPQQ